MERLVETQYGFQWFDHTGKLLIEVSRACSSSKGERSRWVCLDVKTPTMRVQIQSKPRKTHITKVKLPHVPAGCCWECGRSKGNAHEEWCSIGGYVLTKHTRT